MQLGLGKTLFPSWSASLTLIKDHGTSAAGYAASAVKAKTGTERLDAAIRAMTSFDHAIDNTANLPVSWFVPSSGKYFRGYEAAKQAVTLLINSDLIPGAKMRVGRQTLTAAKEAFLAGVEVARSDRSRFGGKLSTGWLDASLEDAATGASFLGSDVARALVAGVRQARTAADNRKGVDEQLVATVTQLFDRAGAQFDAMLAGVTSRSVVAPDAARIYARVDALLLQAAEAATALAAAAIKREAQLPTGVAA